MNASQRVNDAEEAVLDANDAWEADQFNPELSIARRKAGIELVSAMNAALAEMRNK